MDDIGAELRRLANTDPLAPIDGHDLLERGRRSRRRRRLLSAGGGIASVAAVAVAASLLPHAGTTTSKQPTVSGPQTTKPAPDFTAVPGIPRGEAGAGRELSYAETNRLCSLRYPMYPRPVEKQVVYRTGMTVMRQRKNGDPLVAAFCTVPGGDRPSAALVAAAQRDPMPATEAGQLRNCSVQFWTDLTKWKVVARETAPGAGANLVALSPSGRLAVQCALSPNRDPAAPLGSGPGIYETATRGRDPFDHSFLLSGGELCATVRPCPGWAYLRSGRVASNIARIRIEPVAGGRHDITVTDGWFAVAWLNGDRQGRPDAKLTAYDKRGKVLEVVGP